jgi:branched-chain amino acid transport system substrate-binding protein
MTLPFPSQGRRPIEAAAVFIVALLSVALPPAGCSRGHDPAEERVLRARKAQGDVVVAAAWPWALRKEIRYGEGLDLAVDEVNRTGGIAGRRLRLVRYDDEESIDKGRLVAQEIAGDPDVVAVIGHLQSYITVQAANVYDQAGLVLVAPTATDPELTERGYRRVFRATFTDKSVGRQLADFVAARELKRVAIGYIRNTYGRNVANAFEARAAKVGLQVVARSSYDPSEQASERSFEGTLQEWKTTEMDAIVLAGEVPSAAIFVARARALGLHSPIVGGDAMSSPGLMAVAGPAAEGVMVASFFHPDRPAPEIQSFEVAFRKRYGTAPDAGSALGYDCVHLLARAMRQAGSTAPDAVARALGGGLSWNGVTGTFAFDEHGDMVSKPITISVVRRGRFEYLGELGKGGPTLLAAVRP